MYSDKNQIHLQIKIYVSLGKVGLLIRNLAKHQNKEKNISRTYIQHIRPIDNF